MPVHFFRFFPAVLFLFAFSCSSSLPEAVVEAGADLPEKVDFNQHIRPLLADRCWACHGPDAESRQAELRLDTEAGAFAALASGAGKAFVAGSPGRSESIQRMISDDPELRMPPPESHLELSDYEIALFARWIEEGAEWKRHWSFIPLEPTEVPANPADYSAANDIDHFINRELSRRKLPANERADDERLLRRLCLDLTGLPPSPALMDRWLANPSAEAYTLLVDSLLQTPAHAERLAMEWMDLARYSDSHGLHADGKRLSYPYRDWVIKAYADNKPFDKFVTEQLAGDLLPDPTQDQLLATAFNRMHPMTAEGGAIDEEFRLSYVFDRVNTVATGIMGLTMDCSRCHDHKFDPISQEGYYAFSAFFNNVVELGMIGDDGNFGPYMLLADTKTDSLLKGYQRELDKLEATRDAVTITEEELAAFINRKPVKAPKPNLLVSMDKTANTKDGQHLGKHAWATKEFDLIEDDERGMVANFDHPYKDMFLMNGLGVNDSHEPVSASLYAKTTQLDSSRTQTLLCTAGQKNTLWRGMEFYLDQENRLNIRFIRTLPDDLIHVRSQEQIPLDEWTNLSFTYDGSAIAKGLHLYINGEPATQETIFNRLRGKVYPGNTENGKNVNGRQVRVGQSYRAFTGENGIFKGYMDDLRMYKRALTPLEVKLVVESDGQQAPNLVREHLKTTKPEYRKTLAEIQRVQKTRLAVADTVRRMMVTEEMEKPRPTFVLNRGAYDDPRQEVHPSTPGGVLNFADDLPRNREGLAQWLFQAEHPLTARVAVNRYWQLIFGRGIVDTPHDFGSQGSLPSHPELLDYLANHFRDKDWNVRDLIRMMVTSDTYQRSSIATEKQREMDAENIFLARGPSYRLQAEFIRDNALAAAGLLNRKVGGPSARPYQPDGLWIQANSFSKDLLHYKADAGDQLYRRSMYTFIRRTVPPPFMVNFDMAGRDVCTVKRSQTNTPLQALNLLNDPQFVEAARVLAQRIQTEKDGTRAQLNHAFRLLTGRMPQAEETTILEQLYRKELARFKADPEAAKALIAVGEYPALKEYDPLQTAALASVSNTLMSFDEAYVKR